VPGWPTAAMKRFRERFVPWAESKIAEEVASGYSNLRSVPGPVAESALDVLSKLGPERAHRYMLGRVKEEDDSWLESVLAQMLEISAHRRLIPRTGFDKRTFLTRLPKVLEETGHEICARDKRRIIAQWSAGATTVRTEIAFRPTISYIQSATHRGEIACPQISLMAWLGLDAATTYEPSAEHEPEAILGHMQKCWRTFVEAAPALID